MIRIASFITACSLCCTMGTSGLHPIKRPTFQQWKKYCITATVNPCPTPSADAGSSAAPSATPKPSQTITTAPSATPKPSQDVTTTPSATPKPSQDVTTTPSATPTPSQTVTPAPTPIPSGMDEYAMQVVEMVNEERAKQGLGSLNVDAKATIAASIRAEEISVSFSHTRPSGESCFTALQEAGASYTGAGENIAKGQMTAERVMASWMSSSGHYANIMKDGFTRIGVGHKVINGVHYWVQMFLK